MSLGELEKIHEPLWATPLRGCVKHDRHLVKIRNGKMRYYLPEEQAIDEIKRTHIEKGHLGILTIIHRLNDSILISNLLFRTF